MYEFNIYCEISKGTFEISRKNFEPMNRKICILLTFIFVCDLRAPDAILWDIIIERVHPWILVLVVHSWKQWTNANLISGKDHKYMENINGYIKSSSKHVFTNNCIDQYNFRTTHLRSQWYNAWRYFMMTLPNGNVFRVTGPLCGEFTGHRLNSLHKGQWRRALMFLWSVLWING